jgi:hypothetical protein
MLLVLSRTALPQDVTNSLIADVLSASVTVAAIITVCDERHFRIVALALGGPIVLLQGTLLLVPNSLAKNTQLLGCAAYLAAVVFLSFTVVMLVRSLVKAPIVTWDTVIGAFSGYVLIGVVWTQLYCAIDLVNRQAFSLAGQPLAEDLTRLQRHALLEYFSFSTLSTVGFGDLVPVSQTARGLATFEAICGQFYLAVLVAGLIGIRTTVPKSDPQKSESPTAADANPGRNDS